MKGDERARTRRDQNRTKASKSSATRGRGTGLVSDTLRLLVAAGLLGAVALVTVGNARKVNASAQTNRVADRMETTHAVAGALADAIDTMRSDASQVAAGADPAEPTSDIYRVDRGGRFTSASGLTGSTGLRSCAAGAGLNELTAAAGRSTAPVVLVLSPPGTCKPVVGAAIQVPGGAVVVERTLNDLLSHAAIAAHLPAGIRTFIIDPAGTLLSPREAGASRVPAYLAPFVASASSSKAGVSGHYRADDAQHTSVVDVGAAIGDGWSVVIEQDADTFDVAPVTLLSRSRVVTVVGLVAMVLLLQAMSDASRRRVARRVDAHAAAFLAVLGHELRTPLTVIKGFVDTLSSRWGSLDESQRHELVDRLPQQSRRLSRVVERLLLAANLQAGSAPRLTVGSVAVEPALERVASDFTPLAPLHQFVVDAAPQLMARGDAKALDQILEQLVDNAVKYSPFGGTVRLAAVRRHGRLEIAVEDEGIGLPPNARGIFNAFAQGESVDGRVHDEGGVGVGLYIVRTLAEQVGGSVRAERKSDGGSRFVVILRSSNERKSVRTSATRHQ